MTRRIDARGSDLSTALRDAVASLLERDSDDVSVDLDAPGLVDVTGKIRFDLEIDPSAMSEAAAADDEPDARDETISNEPTSEPAAAEAPGSPATSTPRAGEGSSRAEPVSAEELDAEADAAADFLEGLLDALDLPGDLRIRLREEHAEVEVTEVGNGALIGRRGQTLEAIQELVRCSLQREFQRRSRVQVDVEGYRARRLEKLVEKAEEVIAEVLDSGDAERLEPMDVFERKVIHNLVAEHDGVLSRSQGREPGRRVVIERA